MPASGVGSLIFLFYDPRDNTFTWVGSVDVKAAIAENWMPSVRRAGEVTARSREALHLAVRKGDSSGFTVVYAAIELWLRTKLSSL